MKSLGRLLRIAAVLGRHALAHGGGRRLERWPRLARRLPPAELPEPQRLRSILEDLGGTFIKLGQMLALQPDILPLEYCNALFDLLDRVPPVEVEEVEAVLTAELGRPIAEVFESFDRAPLASASVAQVHLAGYRGREVAVKVQRPTVAADFAGDIRLMQAAMRWIRRLRLQRLYWLLEPLTEFIAWTEDELDFRREARAMERLRRDGRQAPAQKVPEIFPELGSRRVLVAEYLGGVTILEHLRARENRDEVTRHRLARMGFDADTFATHVVDNFFTQVFAHGLFHADLHPANLMILADNCVGYLDFGITGALSPFSRRLLVTMTLAHTRGDVDRMAAAMLEVSVPEAGADVDGFGAGMRRLAAGWYERRGDGSVRLCKSFTMVMLDMLQLSRATGVWPERDIIKYIRSAMAVDGLITRLAPDIDLGATLDRVCSRHLERHTLAQRMSSRNLLDWSAASARLMLDGGLRAAALLDRLAADGAAAGAGAGVPERRHDGDRPVALATIFVLTMALLTTLSPESSGLGFNLLTAEMLLLAAGLWKLLGSVRAPA
jgi:ubiquinone biosynthesis protein